MLEFKDFETDQGAPDTMGAMKVNAPKKDKPEPPLHTPEPALDVGADFFEEDDGLSEEDRSKLMKQMVALAEKYGDEKQSISAAEQKVKGRKRELREMEEKLFAMLEVCGMSSFGTGAHTYYTRIDSYPSIAMEKAAFKWIKDEGFEHIIKLNVNLKTLGSMIKEVFNVTGAMPGEDDGIDIRTVNRVGVRKR